MHDSLRLQVRTFPSRIAELGFSAELPADWITHEIPGEQPEFADPTRFFPLAVVAAPHAAIVFAFGARPAYDDGTLQDWTWYHLNNNPFKPRAVGPAIVAEVPAMLGEATQDSEMGPMVVRFAFFEDGGRLVNITFTAPELLADAVRDAWFAVLRSFRLENPRGSRFAAEPDADVVPESKIQSDTGPVTDVSPIAEEPPRETSAVAPKRKTRFHDFALGADTTSVANASASASEPPAWWHQALALEALGEFEAAESVIRRACPFIGFAISTAEMYRLRMVRLKEAGDEIGARDAFKRAKDFAFYYASLATSGGEGAVLSLERDQFSARLIAELGYDPELAQA